MDHRLVGQFVDQYGRPPGHIVRSPGRVNLIADHTDYNDGFALPMAIDQCIWVLSASRDDREIALRSSYAGDARLHLDRLERSGSWVDYVAGDVATVGEAMNQSHRSLRDDFEVLSAELDLIAGLGREQAGCHGTRQTGAGFAGCAVALVDSDLVQDFVVAVGTAYREATSVSPHLYPTSAAAPVGLISPE
jgi:galactokinase